MGVVAASVKVARQRATESWYALVPAFVALLLGWWGISNASLWLDERITLSAVENGLAAHASEAPLLPYYAVILGWTGGGMWVSDGWLRALSVVATSVGSVAVAVTTRRLLSVKAGLAAGMIFALAPGVSRYAQEARPYALAAALVSVATMFLVDGLVVGKPQWLGYALALSCAALLMPVSFAAIPAHAVILTGIDEWRTQARGWLMGCLLMVPLAGLQVLLLTRFSDLHGWLAAPTIVDLPWGLTFLTSSEYSGELGTAFSVAVIALAAVSKMGFRWLLGSAAAVVSIWILSVGPMSWWTTRSFIPLAGIMAIAAAASVAEVDWARVLAVLGILGLAAAPTYVASREPGSRGVNMRVAAEIVDANGRAGDVISDSTSSDLLWWAAGHYLAKDSRFALGDAADHGRRWILGDDPSCVPDQTWELPGDGRLGLCVS